MTGSWQFLRAGITLFHERYGDAAAAQSADRTRAARQSIPVAARREEAAQATDPPPDNP